jgi:hypothetical protein
MRPLKPKLQHPPEVYQAIIREHRENALRMGERLMAYGWTLADAAWSAVNWNLLTLAAAVANERAKRDTKPTSLSDGDLDKLRAEIDAAQKPPHTSRPRRTTRIMRTMPKLPQRPSKRGDEPKAR